MATEGLQVSNDASELGSDSSQGRVARRTMSQLSDLMELSVQLGAMVDNPEYSDIVFVCNDGVQVRASRMMLTARSSVFKGTLGSGMLESKLEQIPLPNLSSAALLPVLEFLYAGDFHKYEPKGYATLEVMRVAQNLLLPKLERKAFNLAVLHLESLREDYDIEALEQKTIDLFCVAAIDADLANILSTTRSFLDKIVAQMNQRCITLTILEQLTKEQMQIYVDIAPRFREKRERNKKFVTQVYVYLRLRLILLWCATRVSMQAASSLEGYLPQREHIITPLCEAGALGVDLEHYSPPNPCVPWQNKDVSVQSRVAECRDLLQLEDVPAQLLCQIIEPLNVVPPSIMYAAYRRKALSHEMGLLKWDSRMHSREYIVREGGFVVGCRDGAADMPCWPGPGIARACRVVDTDRDTGVRQWEFIVEKWCDNLQLGFIDPSQCTRKRRADRDLGSVGWALTDDGLKSPLCTVPNRTYMFYASNSQLEAGSRVRVYIDGKGNCSCIINGVDYGIAWVCTPTIIIPACTLSHPGRVRIQNVV